MINDALERFLISLILQSKEACSFAKGKLSKEDFEHPFHGQILDALFHLPETSPWTLNFFAERMGVSKLNGEFTELNSLYTEAFQGYFDFKAMGSVLALEDAIGNILNRSKKRFAKLACTEVAKKCDDSHVDIQIIEAEISEIQSHLCAGSQKKTWRDRTSEWMAKFEEKYDSKVVRSPLGTGMPSIDKLIHRFIPGDLVVVSARRKVGKSAFMVGIVNRFSIDGNIPGLNGAKLRRLCDDCGFG